MAFTPDTGGGGGGGAFAQRLRHVRPVRLLHERGLLNLLPVGLLEGGQVGGFILLLFLLHTTGGVDTADTTGGPRP